MVKSVIGSWTDATVGALSELRDAERAAQMAAYMKNVSAFLGVPSPARRAAQKSAWASLVHLDEGALTGVCDLLWELPEREYQYAACDLLVRHARSLPAAFIIEPVERLLTTKPWWDTVDSLGSAAVTPIVARHPHLVDTMWRWMDSGDTWLIRAAVQHQRGLKERTDIELLLEMCDRVSSEREFFIAKAVGWALRDATAIARSTVQSFVDDHPDLSAVARREAVKGLARSARP